MNFTKTCTVCQIEYPATVEFFYKSSSGKYSVASKCKKCVCSHSKIKYSKLDDSERETLNNKKSQRYYYNRTNYINKHKKWRTENREIYLNCNKKYYLNNREQKIEQSKKYQRENRKKRNKYRKNRRDKDVQFRIIGNLRSRIRSALYNTKKNRHTMELLGCSIEELKIHLEMRFTKGMSWDNYGFYGWHIDHIIPCASFDLTDPEQQKKCFHYTNLQPLWAEDNYKKRDKIL